MAEVNKSSSQDNPNRLSYLSPLNKFLYFLVPIFLKVEGEVRCVDLKGPLHRL